MTRLEDRTVPTIFTVTSLADAGAGSLREAISLTADGDAIHFATALAGGTINLTSGQLEISHDITIETPGRNWIRVQRDSGASTPFFRIFQVDRGADVTLSGLIVAGGKLSFPVGSTVAYNQSYGAGIFSGANSTLTITDSLISDNRAGGLGVNGGPVYAWGGGIYSQGAVSLTDSTVTNNFTNEINGPLTQDQPWTGLVAEGAGIWSDGNLTIVRSAITGNSIAATPYGQPTGGPHPINEFSKGGGVYTTATAPLTMTRTVVSSNHVDNTIPYNGMDNRGGGLYLSADATVTDSWIDQNYAGGYYGIVSEVYGAGIYNDGATVTIDRTSITGNNAAGRYSYGGGVYNLGTLAVTDSTVSSNRAGWDHTAPISRTALGGGIYNGGSLTVTAGTVTKNVAVGRALDGYVVAGGGIYNAGGPKSATVNTTILAGNSSFHEYLPWQPQQPWVGPDAAGAFLSDGYNLVGNTSDSTGWLVTDLTGVDPILGPLQNNGGPLIGTFVDLVPTRVVFTTHEVLAGSPALRAGNPLLTPFTDQRGVERDHSRPNIGAYEATLDGFRVEQAAPGTIYVNTPFSLRVTAIDPFGKTVYVYGGTVGFSSSDPGATLPSYYLFAPSDNGTHVFTGVTFSLTGHQTITVADVGDPSKDGVGTFEVFGGGSPPPPPPPPPFPPPPFPPPPPPPFPPPPGGGGGFPPPGGGG